ncbi:hypothetical protein V9K67_14050 [Paraflavisolibacter sp. H34]|uniref:hypothetical protein n=1 Tax=Huijunlia imazamoxiresistens TaxID=3127457 RepID=UPI00301933DF
MILQTWYLFQLQPELRYLLFVFFGSLCSYNFHMLMTPGIYGGSEKMQWSVRHRWLHLALFLLGLAGAGYYVLHLLEHWPWLMATAFITFMYSAPKVPFPIFRDIKKIAIGKTVFLALVWTHSTALLPLVVSQVHWQGTHGLFILNRFFLIYAICVVFDFRDREEDKREGIRTLITYLSERGINILFWCCLLLFAFTTLLLYRQGFAAADCIALFLPGLILALLYDYSKKQPSDVLYLFVLDGLMMFSAVLLFLLHL